MGNQKNILIEQHLTKGGIRKAQKETKSTEQGRLQNNLYIHNLGYLKNPTLWRSPSPLHHDITPSRISIKSLSVFVLISLPHRISFEYPLSKCIKINTMEPCAKPSFVFSPSPWPSILGEGEIVNVENEKGSLLFCDCWQNVSYK